jgi:metal transporter CNNM
MESLPLAVNKVASETNAILLSTVGLLIFGEVLPQAFCTGEHQLDIANAMAPIVKGMICLLYPLVKPIGWALDRWLGEHEEKKRYDQEDLITILKLHKNK